VNPLAPYYRQAPEPVDVERVFRDPERPLHIDVGSARGRFLLRMAEAQPRWNYLGVEIREPLVTEANRLADEAGFENLHYAFCNAMLWLGKLLEALPPGVLQMASVQFPDPWFKKKHAKRRMVNEQMVDALAERLAPGGRVFVQTDIDFLAGEIFDLFRSDKRFHEVEIAGHPFPVRSEREKAVGEKGLTIYRALFASI
jgi:tRNA (guanine-N7-)-methyltransferase